MLAVVEIETKIRNLRSSGGLAQGAGVRSHPEPPPPKKGGPLGQHIQLPMMMYVIDVNHSMVAILCKLS